MSRAPKWRVRGGKLKEEQKKEMNRSKRGLVFYFRAGDEAIREDCPIDKEEGKKARFHFSKNSSNSIEPSLIGKNFSFSSNKLASPGSSTIRAPFPPYGMLSQHRPTMLRASSVFARQSLLSSPLAVWTGCPSLLRSFKLWIKGTNVVEWNSRRVKRSTVLRYKVQVVIITSGYALAPLTGTPEPANTHENLGRSVLHSSDRRYG
ncbi:hypothetical protein RDI58_007844 [Solanum bulbocastanum]|uniref:Uncharacterized protein n=1 Tax=Solanum bulbocastanum TaxID=147425 RepID=A0AAN8U1F1_SOLBU